MAGKDRRSKAVPVGADRRGPANRREHERIPATLEVDYQSEDTYLYGWSADVSELGIFIRSAAPYPVDTRLTLYFRQRGKQAIKAQGRVVQSINPALYDDPQEHRKPGMGVAFVDLPAAEREQIVALVRTLGHK